VDLLTLRTERLVLLPLGPADLDETAALYGDPDVMRFVAGGVMGRAPTADRLDTVAECWRIHGFGLWSIRDAETGAFLGEGGLQRVSRPEGDGPHEDGPHGDGPDRDGHDIPTGVEVEFGYTLCRRGWGHGYASEAGTAMLDDAWGRYRGSDIHAFVTADNLQSQKVLEKLGFTTVTDNLAVDGRSHQLWVASRP
jgi:RimJ/RimL family protein N-acetyltransferase